MSKNGKEGSPAEEEEGERRSVVCIKVLRVVLAFLATCTNFQSRAFAMYLLDLKEQFFLKQVSVEMCMAMNYLGFSSTFPAGYFINKAGLCVVGSVGLIISTGAFLAIWAATNMTSFYHENEYLLQFYFFMAGAGCGTSYVVATTATARLITGRYRGLAIAFLSTALNIGPIIFITCYETYFKEANEDGSADLSTYFLVVAVSMFTLNFVGLLAYGKDACSRCCDHRRQNGKNGKNGHETEASKKGYQKMDGNTEETVQKEAAANGDIDMKSLPAPSSAADIEDDGDEETKEAERKAAVTDIIKRRSNRCGCLLRVTPEERLLLGFGQVVRVPLWHYTIWSSFTMLGIKWMSVGNVNTFLTSMGLSEYEAPVLYTIPTLTIFVKLAFGYISDHPPKAVPLSVLLLPPVFANVLAFILAMTALGNIYVFFFIVIMWTVNAITVVTPLMLIDDFGMFTFPVSIGIVYFGQSVLTFLSQLWFGAFYDHYAKDLALSNAATGSPSALFNNTTPAPANISQVAPSQNVTTFITVDGVVETMKVSLCYGQKCFMWSFIICLCICVMSAVFLVLHICQITKERRRAAENEEKTKLVDKDADQYGAT